ncbi:hypothetical protein [Thermosulfurimonas dismutans]|uniref:Uncharacterized protein n=1 Tax=Thermosulfurimonas dismutans TaxID=999894 RepID=A0A179D3F8_9BACT|nr:hypothetical protein [Thermosulfurimonas dismutans]OAQ20614.1 hypothetical protein TDIS_1229 [Thermosulfurimonas dismutans]
MNKKILIILVIILGIFCDFCLSKNNNLFENEESSSVRREAVISCLKDIILYQHIIELLAAKEREDMKQLQTAKDETESRYWALVILEYEGLKLYYFGESLSRILILRRMLERRDQNEELLEYVHNLERYFQEAIVCNPIGIRTIELIKGRELIRGERRSRDEEAISKAWIELRKHFEVLKRDFHEFMERKGV